MGYTPTSRQYRIYNLETRIIERFSTVRFDEIRKGGTLFTQQQDSLLRLEQEELPQDDDIGDTIVVRTQTPEPQGDSGSQTPEPESEHLESAGEAPAGRQSRSGRAIRLPERYQAQRVVTSVND